MAADYMAVDTRDRVEESLDTAFDVLAHAHRRAVIEELEREAPLALAELAERIADRDGSTSRRAAEVELAHRHLPRLDDAGVVEYDTSSRRCELDRAEMVRSVLDAVREAA